MNAVSCILLCQCGGHVSYLHEDIYYVLTEKRTIIFRGVCSLCGELVKVERDILSLILTCPNKDGERGN